MKPEIKSITIYVRESQLTNYLRGEDYRTLVWTHSPGDPHTGGFYTHKQVQLQISIDSYYAILDAQADVQNDAFFDINNDFNQLQFPF